MTCTVCGRDLVGFDIGRYWVWVHVGITADHYATPVRAARRD